jgi:glucose dehydrogenase
MMRRSGDRYLLLALTALSLALICGGKQQARAGDLNALSQDDKQWVMAPKNYASTRYSGLDQINAGISLICMSLGPFR